VNVWTTAPLEDPREIPGLFRRLEEIGYDGAFTFEAKHDPFLPLALASTTTTTLGLGTAVAIALARTPMTLANTAYDLQVLTKGRFVLGLGTQVRPHVERRFGMPWSRPVRRMREMVQAIRAIWQSFESGGPLRYEGDIYRHTLMIPAFNPGPNPFGAPPILLGGFGPRMIETAGEVADGFIAHPFNSRKSLLENVMPSLQRGLAASGRARRDFKVVCATIVVTAGDEGELERSKAAVKKQLAFYGSTPVYRSTLECHGLSGLHEELNRLSKLGRWDDMAALISDDFLDAIAVVGPRDRIAALIRDRLDGIADAVTLTNNRAPDPTHWSDVVAELKRGQSPFSRK
jgi:probable F420-dependent oxidoreductase